MICRKECIGIALIAFGAGMILAALFQSTLCPILLGLAAAAAGIFLIK